MPTPSPRQVFDDPAAHWDFITQASATGFESGHFDRKEAGQIGADATMLSRQTDGVRNHVKETVSAFANKNAEGGVLVLGVADDGTVKGMNHLTEQQINSITDFDTLLHHQSAEVSAESEEERAVQSYDIRPHPQRDVDGVCYQVGLWQLELRDQEDIWFVNHGLKDVRRMEEQRGESPGFPLCPVCGDYFKPSDFAKKKPKKSDDDEKDSRSRIDAHAKRCTGQIKSNPGYALGHHLRADTLRLVVPNISAYGDEAVKCFWSFVYATIQGAVRLFEIDPEDIEAYVLTKARKEGCESPQQLHLLKAIRADGTLSEPEEQFEVFDQNKLLTRADFAYTDCKPKLLMYVDGLAFHSDVRQRVHDNRITNRLQMMGYLALRFLGTETHNTPGNCVAQIKQAREPNT